jgi:hypothetical protein
MPAGTQHVLLVAVPEDELLGRHLEHFNPHSRLEAGRGNLAEELRRLVFEVHDDRRLADRLVGERHCLHGRQLAVRFGNRIAVRIVPGISEPCVQGSGIFGRYRVFPPIRGDMDRLEWHLQFVGEIPLEESMRADDPHGDLLAAGGEREACTSRPDQPPCLHLGDQIEGRRDPETQMPGERLRRRRRAP